MARLFVVLGYVLLAGIAQATEVADGLSVGNDLQWVPIRGEITVICDGIRGQREHGFFNCYRPTLDPAEYAYFVTRPGGSASVVHLSSLRADGSRQDKETGFNPSTGRSTKSINLWISTLLQRPLLKPGVNRVDFELVRDNGSVERRGQFEVSVTKGQGRTCPHRTYFSSNLSDCRFGDMICDRYFREYNYCH